MELSEGKLFTIEALNRVEGFEWPERATSARLECFLLNKEIHFFSNDGFVKSVGHSADNADGIGTDVAVSRAEFESVDGWVRNDGKSLAVIDGDGAVEYLMRSGNLHWESAEFVDLIHTGRDGDIMKWRYCKQQKQDKQPTQQPESSIETLISQHKAAKQSTLEARRLLEHAEAIEHNLLLSIEAWAESNGFYIGQLNEVKK